MVMHPYITVWWRITEETAPVLRSRCRYSIALCNRLRVPALACYACWSDHASDYLLWVRFFSAPMDKRRTTMHGRALQLDSSTSSYLISASLITSGVYSTLQICHKPDLETVGILSAFQMSRIHLWGRYYWGTGLITVSPAFLSCAFKLLIQFLPGRWNIFRYLVHCIRGRFRLVTVLAPRNRQGT